MPLLLFSDGLMAYTSESISDWKILRNPTDLEGWCNYYPEVFLDAVLHKGNVVGVDEDGRLYSWAIDVNDNHLSECARRRA